MGAIVGIGLLNSATIALIAVGFAIIFRVVGFLHFAHGAIYAWGAYVAYLLLHVWNLSLPLAVALSVAVGGLLGLVVDRVVYEPLRRRRADNLALLLASLGVFVVLQNLISLIFGDAPKTLRFGETREALNLIGIRLTPVQLGIIAASFFAVCGVAAVLHYTSWGRDLRAVANDADLAHAMGVRRSRVVGQAFAVGSGLAVFAAILLSFDVDMTPLMGVRGLILGLVAIVIGGTDSIIGISAGALMLGFAQSFSAWHFGIEWQDAFAFSLLVLFLLVRPGGFLGLPLRTSET